MFKIPNHFCGGGLQLLNSTAALPLFRSSISPGRGLQTSSASRGYATGSNFPHQDYSWPSTSSLTPYDVLNLPRGAPYSKRHYYDLVKIYHPDRPLHDHPLFQHLTSETRLLRYRIVVDAHELLSDPIKRAAYDQSGAGWSHMVQKTTTDWESHGPSIYANATWEDWERWNNRHQGPQQHVVDQRTFTRLVILLVLFGGALQASWIGKLNTGFEDRLREVNEESARFLHGRRDNTVKQMDTKEARVQGFLIRRDPTGAGLKDIEQSVYEKELNSRRSLDETTQADYQNRPRSAQSAEEMSQSPELS
jgi:curved DNA-binding protein CbpA